VLRVLFVSNGHGERAIAERIAYEVRSLAGEPVELDHLALVGDLSGGGALRLVGPRRAMPSGGLVAMGNVPAFARDLRAGFAGLFASQIRFLRDAGARYDRVIAVGDAYALALALLARVPALFVGTAKSVYVAPYGAFERRLLRRAQRVFVRDEATAVALRARGVAAEAPGNVIVDLLDDTFVGAWMNDGAADAGATDAPRIGLLPGSRPTAYDDAVKLARVVRALAERTRQVAATLSLAPGLEPGRFAAALAGAGWRLSDGDGADVAFVADAGDARLIAWRGSLATLLRASTLVIGQAGTANEQAAALGLPVVALDAPRPRLPRLGPGEGWYRMRQRRLLGDALLLVAPEPEAAASEIVALLSDPARLARMREAGRERMGGPGGAREIARAVLAA
jgi:uncharacterized protein (TIGR03492 family)